MPRQGTGKGKEEQPLLMIILNGLKMGLEDWEKLQEGFVFIHCIFLSCGVEKKFKEKEIGFDFHRRMEDLRLRRHNEWSSTHERDEKRSK